MNAQEPRGADICGGLDDEDRFEGGPDQRLRGQAQAVLERPAAAAS